MNVYSVIEYFKDDLVSALIGQINMWAFINNIEITHINILQTTVKKYHNPDVEVTAYKINSYEAFVTYNKRKPEERS